MAKATNNTTSDPTVFKSILKTAGWGSAAAVVAVALFDRHNMNSAERTLQKQLDWALLEQIDLTSTFDEGRGTVSFRNPDTRLWAAFGYTEITHPALRETYVVDFRDGDVFVESDNPDIDNVHHRGHIDNLPQNLIKQAREAACPIYDEIAEFPVLSETFEENVWLGLSTRERTVTADNSFQAQAQQFLDFTCRAPL